MAASGLASDWYKNAALLRTELARHGDSNRATAEAHGLAEFTIRKWRGRLGIAPSAHRGAATPARQPVNAWGFGPAPLVKPATRERTELVVFLSDPHYPYQDDRLIRSALALVKDLKPHRVVLNGDLNDFFQLSRFNTGLERLDLLQGEIDAANGFRQAVREAAPDAVVDETEGNHDNRIKSYVARNANALKSLTALRPEVLFRYDELGFRWHPGAGFRLRKNFLVKHGTFVRGEAGASGKAELAAAGISGISGHVHRLCTYRKSGYTVRQWTEQGCLCLLEPDYLVGLPNWQQGCAVGEFSTRSDAFVVYEVPAVDGRLRFGGRSF